MAGIPSLCNCTILVRCTIGVCYSLAFKTPASMRTLLTNFVGAVILLIRFAEFALQTCLDLSTDANTVSHLDSGHLVSNLDGFANDFMTDTDGQWAFSPASSDGVDIGATDTTAFNLNVDVAVFEWFRFELNQKSDLLREWFRVHQSITSFFLKSVHLLWSSIIKPSKVSGYPIVTVLLILKIAVVLVLQVVSM